MHSIFVYKQYYLAFIADTRYSGMRDFDQELTCLVFDRNSKKLVGKIPMPKFLKFFFISPDGYLAGTRYFQDESKVHIYRIDF
jgi:hypothetical protein